MVIVDGMNSFERAVKRIFDLVCSFFGIVVLSPVFLIVYVALRVQNEGSVIFRQERIGYKGRAFNIYKFRTMRVNSESNGKPQLAAKGDERLTKVGKFLREHHLDELPQLFNVLKGDMSIVGPRPTLPYQIERYDERQLHRLDMRPGVTGWAQVNGRNDLTWTEKIEYDLEYVEKYSLWFDIKILFKTIGVVFKSEGIEFTKNDAINAGSAADKK